MSVTSLNSETEQMLDCLKRLDRGLSREEWAGSLSLRKREEANFHDWARDPELETQERKDEYESNHSNMKFYAADRESAMHRENWIKEHAPGRILVDFCCGRGTLTLMAAQAGAALSIGIDISPVSLQGCRRRAAEMGLEKKTYFLMADCEKTGLPDNSVDRIITAGCLHHLDLSYAFPELRRILKPGGRIYAIEALSYNPLIQLYRRLTPKLRTSFEKDHILSLKELKFASRFFEVQNVRFFHLFSIATTPLRNTRWFDNALNVANAMDRAVLKVPPISYLAWQFSFELVKKEES
jgi:ubiquinone/menaquinone biosynthesis C-methylase UbiE